jgi:hypothetical protein
MVVSSHNDDLRAGGDQRVLWRRRGLERCRVYKWQNVPCVNRRPGDVMDIHYHTELTDQECDQIDEWSGTHRADAIESISVHDRLVSVQGHQDHFSAALGTAARQGDLIGELNLALANLRNVWPNLPRPAG